MYALRYGAFALAAAVAFAAAGGADEEKVPLDKVPKAVLAAVKAKYPDAEVKGASREEEKGKTSYEVAIKHKGAKIDVILTPEGKITAVEKTIDTADLPEAITSVIKTHHPKAAIKKAEEITKDGKVTYEVLLVDGDKKHEVVFDPSGKVVEVEDKGKAKDKD